ncbi:hypothetical protein EG68_00008 [Paragonimus skrjabini miyazakii]|uniref:Uncharacterized protein n=1 Tax=Paragonimus skrjabini miyazakii TaxID=59628 RepID=A0A8S9Z5H7_9TREM|nr:hypothetical protein EG68_00008 [Paragonimus skrjabini miyazakii]
MNGERTYHVHAAGWPFKIVPSDSWSINQSRVSKRQWAGCPLTSELPTDQRIPDHSTLVYLQQYFVGFSDSKPETS